MIPTVPVRRLAGLRHGYAFVSRLCDQESSDAVRIRTPRHTLTFLRGAEGSRLFYGGEGVFTRNGAVPKPVQHLLQDEGSVQSLDGEAHHRRKAMFHQFLTTEGSRTAVDLLSQEWQRAVQHWSRREQTELHEQVQLLLTRTALRWAGVPADRAEVGRRVQELSAMVDRIALIGPGNWSARLLRRRTEAWAAELVAATRAGTLLPPEGSALAVISHHRDGEGALLNRPVAAVELINVLRPIVAVSRFIVFAAVALVQHPRWQATFADGEQHDLTGFVHEVRRYFPFFPVVPGRVTTAFEWQGAPFEPGDLAVLDLYGTNHDPQCWPQPESFIPERFRDWDGDPHTLIPQGGGRPERDHRCPGEPMTIALMRQAVRLLTQSMTFEVPVQNLTVPLHRPPALPRDGVLLRSIRPTGVSPVPD